MKIERITKILFSRISSYNKFMISSCIEGQPVVRINKNGVLSYSKREAIARNQSHNGIRF